MAAAWEASRLRGRGYFYPHLRWPLSGARPGVGSRLPRPPPGLPGQQPLLTLTGDCQARPRAAACSPSSAPKPLHRPARPGQHRGLRTAHRALSRRARHRRPSRPCPCPPAYDAPHPQAPQPLLALQLPAAAGPSDLLCSRRRRRCRRHLRAPGLTALLAAAAPLAPAPAPEPWRRERGTATFTPPNPARDGITALPGSALLSGGSAPGTVASGRVSRARGLRATWAAAGVSERAPSKYRDASPCALHSPSLRAGVAPSGDVLPAFRGWEVGGRGGGPF